MNEMSPRASSQASRIPPRQLPPGLKYALEFGPLALFLLANSRPKLFAPILRPFVPADVLRGDNAGLLTATAMLMVASVVALLISFAKIRRLPIVPLVTAAMVLVFGGLTLYFHDKSFIQIKVTIIYALFGLALLGGLAFGRSLLAVMLDSAMTLTERGWRVLTGRWGVFFLALAVLNEVMRRALTWDHWVLFKFPGAMLIVLAFTFTQVPFIMRNELKGEAAEGSPEHV